VNLGMSGKVALVTGGSRGIGRACAESLAAEGCDVMLVARTEADLEAAAAAIAKAGGRRVEICATDLPRAEQIHGADLFVDGGATKTIL
jgi:3-oxoacyl-[acyl-carrier protein] reductase